MKKLTVEERKLKVVKELDLVGLEEWNNSATQRALDMIAKYHYVFSPDKNEIGCTDLGEHEIELTDTTPFKERPHALPDGLIGEVREHLDQMLELGAIRPSN